MGLVVMKIINKYLNVLFVALFCGFNFTALSQIKIVSILPNPAVNVEFVTVNLELETDSYLEIILFNVMGEKVLDVYEDFLDAGKYSQKIYTENLNSGVYFLQFSVNEYVEVWSILVINEISIEEIIKNNTVNIYPNPTTAGFTVSFELEKSCNIQIILCDILGQKLMQIYDGFTTGTFIQTVNTKHLAKGIYFLKIFTDDGNITVKKIIVE